jgi:hypothetical protein
MPGAIIGEGELPLVTQKNFDDFRHSRAGGNDSEPEILLSLNIANRTLHEHLPSDSLPDTPERI